MINIILLALFYIFEVKGTKTTFFQCKYTKTHILFQ